MAKSYDKHTGEGRAIDVEFCKQAIEAGYWQKIKDGGPDALLNMVLERPTTASSKGHLQVIPPTLASSKKRISISEPSPSEKPERRASIASKIVALVQVLFREKCTIASSIHSTKESMISLGGSSKRSVSSDTLDGEFPDFRTHQEAYMFIIIATLTIGLLPLYIHIRTPVLVSLVTTGLCVLFTRWHHARFPRFWTALLEYHHPDALRANRLQVHRKSSYTQSNVTIPVKTDSSEEFLAVDAEENFPAMESLSTPIISLTPMVEESPMAMSPINDRTPVIMSPVLKPQNVDVNRMTPPSRLLKRSSTNSSNGGSNLREDSTLSEASRRLANSDMEYDRYDDDVSSSDGEQEKAPMYQQEVDDDEVDEEELKLFSATEDEDITSLFQTISMENDTELGDVNLMKLRDIHVRIPAFIDKTLLGNSQIHFVMEVSFPNGVRRTVERLYTDFVRLQKYIAKTIPQSKVTMQDTSLPKKKQSNQTLIGLALDQRRGVLESFLNRLLGDEGIAKLGHRVMIEFVRQKGLLFTQGSFAAAARRRFFTASFSGSSNMVLEPSSSIAKHAILMKCRWRSCLKETRISLDKINGVLSIYCRYPALKDPHCMLSMDEIEDVVHLNEAPNLASVIPFSGADKYHFFEVRALHESHYFCASKDVVLDWIREINALKQSFKTSPMKISKAATAMAMLNRSNNGPNQPKRNLLETGSSDNKVILNKRRLILGSGTSATKSPGELATSLLGKILSIFQEYTDSKCVLLPKISERLQLFSEECMQLQVVQLDKLTTHEERLCFL